MGAQSPSALSTLVPVCGLKERPCKKSCSETLAFAKVPSQRHVGEASALRMFSK